MSPHECDAHCVLTVAVGKLLVNTFGDVTLTMGVAGKHPCPAELSVSLLNGMPLTNTLPLPCAILSPHAIGSPILAAAGIIVLVFTVTEIVLYLADN